MKDQSQIDEMRAAIRGDLERGRARQQASPVLASVVEPVSVPEVVPEVVSEPPAHGEPEPRRGLFSSLFKRS